MEKYKTLKELADGVRNIPYIDSDNMHKYLEKLASDIENFAPVIELPCGTDLEDASTFLYQLHWLSIHAVINFNGHMLDSYLHDTPDLVYKEVIGMSKDEFDRKRKADLEKIKNEEKEFQEMKPNIIQGYINQGHEILNKKYWDDWDKIVPIRVNDLYHGFECKSCLELIKMLNDKKDFDEVNKVFDNQNHSGMSHGLVANMLVHFCDRGKEFVEKYKY